MVPFLFANHSFQTAAAKGLILGSIVFNRADGTSLRAGSDREVCFPSFTAEDVSDQVQGVLITAILERDSIDFGSAKWILLVEKEVRTQALVCDV